MTTPLFKPPPIYSLPLSKGGDLLVDFLNKVPGSNPATYVDYPSGVAVLMAIDTDSPIEVTAAIDGHHAMIRIESTITDTIPAGKLWRCIYQMRGDPTTEIVVANGRIVRADGKG